MSSTYQNDTVLDVIIIAIILFLNLKKNKIKNKKTLIKKKKKTEAKLSKGTTSLPRGLIDFLIL